MTRFSKSSLGETFSEEKVLPHPPFQKTFIRFGISVVLVATSFTAHASEVDKLIRELAGGDEAARVTARQLLPRHGMDAVPALIDLLDHDQQPVWRVAHKVLRDIIHGGPVGISDHNRTHISALLVKEIDEAKPDLTRRVLELLSHSAPEGFNLNRVGTLLGNEELRMDARGALELTGTMQAAQVLGRAPMNDEVFAVAVVDSLGSIGGRPAVSALRRHANDRRIAVKLAALRGLVPVSVISDESSYWEALESARATGNDTAIFDAHDVYLRYTDRVSSLGGNWEHALAGYLKILESTDSNVWRGAAIAGLGKRGDLQSIAIIADAIQEHGRELAPQALMALSEIRGREALRGMIEAYGTIPEEYLTLRTGLLIILGRSGDSIAVETLLNESASENESIRSAAVEGLMLGAFPQGAEAASAYAEAQPEGDALKYARRAIKLYAEALSNAGASAAAGRTYVAIHRIAETDADKAIALEGIRRHPTAEGLNVIMADIDLDDLDALPLETLISLAEALHGAQKIAERDNVLDAVVANMKGTGQVQAVAERIGAHEAFAPLASRMGFVRKWHLAGPFAFDEASAFEKNPVNAPNIDLNASYGDVEWKAVNTNQPWGLVNLIGEIGPLEHASAFAYTTINVANATDGNIRTGSDDGIRIWINGELVHTNPADRGAALDSDVVPVQFRQGKNEIVAEISQGLGGWAFTMRLTGADNTPLDFSQE